MKRIKIGDKVYPYNMMSKVGTVTEIYTKSHDTWMVGGSMSQTLYVKVMFDGGDVVEHVYSDLLVQE